MVAFQRDSQVLPGLAQPEPKDVIPAKYQVDPILHCNGPPESP